MCIVLLPPGDNPTAVNKYINISTIPTAFHDTCLKHWRTSKWCAKAGETISSRHVSSCDVTRAVGMWFNIEFYGADSHFYHSAYVTWSRVELWSAHVPARVSNLCCRTHFVRRDVRIERSSVVTSCFQKWWKCLLKKCANETFDMDMSYAMMILL
jgi:hypothetical protein